MPRVHDGANTAPQPGPEAIEATLECVARLAAVRDGIEAVLEGRLAPTSRLIEAHQRLLGKAAEWAARAEVFAA